MKPRLVMVANLWTLAGHPRPAREWTLARKMAAVAGAGFDGVTTTTTPGLRDLLVRHELRFMGFFSAGNIRALAPSIRAQRQAGAEVINVQIADDDTPRFKAARLARALMREARRQGIYTAIEVHRDTATETPEKTYALADDYRRSTGESLPLTWDHSHLAVVKHLKPALFTPVLLKRRKLIQAARLFHLRPFNGQHAQVPVMDARGRLTPEFRLWLKFVEDLFSLWLAGPQTAQELWVCPEIGPVGVHGYNLSGMQPSWDQAVRCRREIVRLWKSLVR